MSGPVLPRLHFRLLGTGSYVPEKVLSNDDLSKMVDTSDEWIRGRTGIAQRHIASEDQSTSTLGAQALRRACESAGVEPQELDAIVVATSTADTGFPSTACWLQRELDLGGMPAFDVAAGCTGWLYALELAASLMHAGRAKKIGVVGSEVMSKVVDWSDRGTCVLFGDGAGAVVLEASQGPSGLRSSTWGADGRLAPILYQPAGGTRKPASVETVQAREHTVHMEGRSVFKHAVRAMVDASHEALRRADLKPEDIDLFVPHQANIRIMDATSDRVGVPQERVYSILAEHGNMSAATVPVAIDHAHRSGRMPSGSKVLMCAFGTGLTWAGAVWEV